MMVPTTASDHCTGMWNQGMISIPAIFAVTTDPFIVFTSNIFAIMGLRALYFLLADMADRFHLL